MKKLIIESNKYKRYKLYFVIFGIIYCFIIFIILTYATLETFSDDSFKQMWVAVGAVIGLWSAIFLPFILYYGIKMLLMRKHSNNYKSYIGTITSIYTSKILRTDHRTVDIKVEGIEQMLYAKVYKGSLYDEVSKNIGIQMSSKTLWNSCFKLMINFKT